MVAPPHKKHPLRRGRKLDFTVTGAGIFQRKGAQRHPAITMKAPQYTEEEKQGFSKTQSASLGWDDHHPNVFGFHLRRDKLVGVLIESENFLLTDRLFLYDTGTLLRPFDAHLVNNAIKYSQEKCNKTLFDRANVNGFKAAVLTRKDKQYNEAMVRVRWGQDGTSKFFIAGDTLEARILVQDDVRIKKQYLVKNSLMDAGQTIPTCYYLPDNPDLHLREYTEAEQQMDRLQAQQVCLSSLNQLLDERRYGILLALPPEMILPIVFAGVNDKKLNVMLTILSQGYIHIFTSLLERILENKQAALQTLAAQLQLEVHHELFWNILFHCVRTKQDELADFIIQQAPVKIIARKFHPTIEQFVDAAEFGYEKFIRLALEHAPHLTNQKHKNVTALHMAAGNGRFSIVELLLTVKNIDVNQCDHGNDTPLMIAAMRGFIEIVNILLSHKDIRIDQWNNYKTCAIVLAVMYGHRDIVNALLAHQAKVKFIVRHMRTLDGKTLLQTAVVYRHLAIVEDLLADPYTDLNETCLDSDSALILAADCGYPEMVTALLARPDCQVNGQNKIGETALIVAARKNHTDILKMLLAHPDTKVNLTDKEDQTALNVATKEGHVKSVELLLQHKDINVTYLSNGEFSALRVAIENHRYVIVDILLAAPGMHIQMDDHIDWVHAVCDNSEHDYSVLVNFFRHPTFDLMVRLPQGYNILPALVAKNKMRIFELILSNPALKIDLEDDRTYSQFLAATKKPTFAKILHHYLVEKYLPQYIQRRDAQDDYKHFYGWLFGKSKSVKINAAQAILNGDDHTPHQAAFRTGELKCVYTLLEECGKTIKQHSRPRRV